MLTVIAVLLVVDIVLTIVALFAIGGVFSTIRQTFGSLADAITGVGSKG